MQEPKLNSRFGIPKLPAKLALFSAALVAAALVAACSAGGGGSESAATPDMDVVLVSNGFGQLLPHQTFQTDSEGNITGNIMDVRELDDLFEHVSTANPIHPTPRLSELAQLPSGLPGNQFIYVRFTNDLDIESILSDRPANQADSGLTGSIVVVAIDPIGGSAQYISGRAFVNGKTYAGTPVGDPPPPAVADLGDLRERRPDHHLDRQRRRRGP